MSAALSVQHVAMAVKCQSRQAYGHRTLDGMTLSALSPNAERLTPNEVTT